MISETTYTEEIHQSAANGCQMINLEQFKAISIWSADMQTKTLADPSSCWIRRNKKNSQIFQAESSNRNYPTERQEHSSGKAKKKKIKRETRWTLLGSGSAIS